MAQHIYAELKENVLSAVTALQGEDFLPPELNTQAINVEQPKDPSHGDLATNAAMVLAKPAKKNPREIAEKLAEKLGSAESLSEVSIAGPGFINFRLSNKLFEKEIHKILQQGTAYGASEIGTGKKVNVEFISANPTGPMHVGHGRGAVFGDVLSNLLEKAGYEVIREYLINDAGGQVITFVKSVLRRYKQLYGQDVELEEGMYPGEYVVDVAKALKGADGDKWVDADEDTVFEELRPFCVNEMMAVIKDDVEALGIHFDLFFSEHAMHQEGKVHAAEQALRDKGYVYEGVLEPPKGKQIDDWEEVELTLFKAAEFGDDVDRPMKKSDGSWTYFGADVAYHNEKLTRDGGVDRLINIWGADHGGTVKRIKAATEALTGQKDALHIKLMQMVKLTRGGEPVKMSKRAGTFVTIRDVIDEVGKDAVRFWFLTRKEDSQLEFDLVKAVEKSNDNPVFYVQYAHARMCAVKRQQQELGITAAKPQEADLSKLTSAHEVAMMKLIASYPVVIELAATTEEPHRLAFFAQELAAGFHSWYNAEKFLLPDDMETTNARLALMEATQVVLQSCLDVMGITPVEKM